MIHIRIRLGSLPALLLLVLRLSAQTNAVAAFDSGYVETGNPFALHLSVPEQTGQPAEVDFSPWDTLLPAQNIVRQSGWRKSGSQWVNDITLLAFDSSELALPPLRVALSDGRVLETNPLALKVLPTPSPDDPADMRDIKNIRTEPANWRDFIQPVLPIVAGVLIFACVVWWLLRRRKKTGLKAVRTIQQPPHELALRKLAELERRQYWQNGQIKTYYSELTYIAREYLEHRFLIPALESASEEIIRLLVAQPELPASMLAPLSELFRWADLAKFAKGAPPEHFHAQALRDVRQTVEQTTPAPQETVNHHPAMNDQS